MDTFASALDLAAAIRAKDVSAVEVADHYLERIERLNPEVNAFVWRNDDEVRKEAKRAADMVVAGDDLPPFHGVPLPIKDLTPVAGQPCYSGSWGAPEGPAPESELVVDAFQRAGFILMGRTNTPELGPLTAAENLRFGITRNPWDVGRSPGGSSGGAAAAVATDMAPIAHGNDGGGSIRIPSSCCGLVGLKPSRARVPVLMQPWEGCAVEGVLTRTVGDAAAALDCISGPDPLMWYNAPAPARPFAAEVGQEPGRLRVAVLETALLGLPVEGDCIAAVRAAAATLAGLGHEVETVEVDLMGPEDLGHFINCVNAGYAGNLVADWSRVEPHNAAGRVAAQAVDSLTYVTSVRALQRTSRDVVARWGRDWDLLITPTMAIVPPEAGSIMQAAHDSAGSGPPMPVMQMVAFTAFVNITGQPAVSLPLHWTEAGLPVGVQLVGAPFDEAGLIRVAAQLEEAVPWSDRRPPLA